MKGIRLGKLLVTAGLVLSLSLVANLCWAAPTVLPSDTKPYGLNYAQWGASWWQWVTLGTKDHHVLRDSTGAEAHLNQPLASPVFFLGGSWVGPVTRNVTVSAGKAFFFPIFNWVLTSPEDVPAGQDPLTFITNTLDSAFNIPGDYLDDPYGLNVFVDGKNLIDHANIKAYRGQSAPFSMYFSPDCFEVTSDTSPITGLPYQAGLHYPNISDGYWVMLAPLDVGQHEIHVTASGKWGDYQDVTYKLTVVPLPTTLFLFGSGLLSSLGLRISRRQ